MRSEDQPTDSSSRSSSAAIGATLQVFDASRKSAGR